MWGRPHASGDHHLLAPAHPRGGPSAGPWQSRRTTKDEVSNNYPGRPPRMPPAATDTPRRRSSEETGAELDRPPARSRPTAVVVRPGEGVLRPEPLPRARPNARRNRPQPRCARSPRARRGSWSRRKSTCFGPTTPKSVEPRWLRSIRPTHRASHPAARWPLYVGCPRLVNGYCPLSVSRSLESMTSRPLTRSRPRAPPRPSPRHRPAGAPGTAGLPGTARRRFRAPRRPPGRPAPDRRLRRSRPRARTLLRCR
jgi:hypothetical protein